MRSNPPRLVGAIALSAAVLATGSASAAAATPALTAPVPHTVVERGGTLPLRVTDAGSGTRATATIDGRAVQVRLKNGGARLSTRGLRPGRHTLHVQIRGKGHPAESWVRTFGVARQHEALLHFVSERRARAALADRFSAPIPPSATVVGVRAVGTAGRVSFTLNGRRVPTGAERSQRRLHAVVLSPDDGLRHGRNVLVVRAEDERRGVVDVERRVIVRSRATPLAAAGRDRAVAPGDAVRLDATGSRSTDGDHALSYAWRITDQPEGAKAKLSSARSARPTLQTRKAGHYRIALRVRERGVGAAPAATDDVVTIEAAPPVPPAGMQVELRTDGADDDMTLSMPAAVEGGEGFKDTLPCSHGYFCTWKLDARTLAPVKRIGISSTEPEALAARDASVAGPDAVKSYVQESSGFEYGTGPEPGLITLQLGPSLAHSAVYVGTTRVAGNSGRGRWLQGGLRGRLMRNISEGDTFYDETEHGSYTFRYSHPLPFTTRLETAKGQTNTFQVGDASYSTSLPEGQSGFAVLSLDDNGQSTNGTPKAFATNTGNADASKHNLGELQAVLDAAIAADDVVLLQSIGAPHYGEIDRTTWNLFGYDRIKAKLGGNAEIFEDLATDSDETGGSYALVAQPGDIRNPGAGHNEVSVKRRPGGAIHGRLTRNGEARLVPSAVARGVGLLATTDDVTSVAFGAGSAWPAWSQGEAPALEHIIAEVRSDLGFKDTPTQLCPGGPDFIRQLYCKQDSAILANLKASVAGVGETADAAAGYTTADVASVKKRLTKELSAVLYVKEWELNLWRFLAVKGPADKSTADSIVTAIEDGLHEQEGEHESETFEVVKSAVMTTLIPLHTQHFMLETLSSIMESASEMTAGANPSGEAILRKVRADADEGVATLLDSYGRFNRYFDRIGDLIVSDPKKLTLFGDNYVQGRWHFDPNDEDVQVAMNRATRQWLWGHVLSSSYTVYEGVTDLGDNPSCLVPTGVVDRYTYNPTYHYFFPFRNGGFGTEMKRIPAVGANDWLGLKGGVTGRNDIAPPGDVLRPLFSSIDKANEANAGAVQPWFFYQWFPSVTQLPGFEKWSGGCRR